MSHRHNDLDIDVSGQVSDAHRSTLYNYKYRCQSPRLPVSDFPVASFVDTVCIPREGQVVTIGPRGCVTLSTA